MLRFLPRRHTTVPLDQASSTGAAIESAPATTRFVSLRRRLLLLLLLVLVPWLALVLYTQADERRVAMDRVEDDATRLIHIVTSSQAAQIEAARQLLTAFARLPQLRTHDPAACSAFMAEMLKAYPLYLNLGVIRRDGMLECSGLPMTAPIDVADRGYFRQARSTRAFAIGDYQIGRITRRPSINYAYPLVDAAGEVEAVVYAAQSLDWLTLALAGIELPGGAVLFVTDRNGTLLARVPDGQRTLGETLPEAGLLASLAGRNVRGLFEADDANGVRRLWARAPLIAGHELHATIGVSKSAAFADIHRRLARNLAALAVVTLLASGVAWFGARFLLRQIDALVAATRRLASGDLGARVPIVGSRSEIGWLAGAFNTMAETLQTRDRELRAAQERTRAAEIELAVARAEIDIARQIQQSLLADASLSVAGVRFAGRCIPAAAVGGDYFGYLPRGDSGVDSLISDVSGHGVGAALLMAEARTTFMAERLVAGGASPLLFRLNEVLYDDLDRAQLFMSAGCARVDAVRRELSYASAGHPPALLLRATETACAKLDADGTLLGIDRNARFGELTMPLRTGDIVVLYTDGITDARNETGELFGVARLEDAIVANRSDDPEDVVRAVLSALAAFAGTRAYDDDCTIVAMTVTA